MGKNLTRRSVLSNGVRAFAAASLAGVPKLSLAAGASGRTLVCVYLFGGNDGNSMLAPLEGSQYDSYAKTRGELAIAKSELVPVDARSSQTRYGLHPSLAALQLRFTEGSLAVVANVGAQRRITPLDRSKLQPIPSSIRYDSLSFIADGYSTLGWAAARAGITGVDRDRAFTFPGGISMVSLDGGGFNGSRRRNPQLIEAAAAASFRTPFPDTPASDQLRRVAGLVKSGHGAGHVFLVPVNGFNQTRDENSMLPPLYQQLGDALSAFHQAMQEIGADRQVTLFTESEFGRSLRPNESHGTNPGWGNHQLVLGGAVLGSDIYGTFPDLTTASVDADGALIPSTSRDQYHASLANWAGVSYSDLVPLFPSVASSSTWRMPFMS